MAKRKQITNYKIKIEAICPGCEEPFEFKITPYDINSSESDCELCGSHGEISIDVPKDTKCPKCGTLFDSEIELVSW